MLAAASGAIAAIRSAKSAARLSMRAPVTGLTVSAAAADLEALTAVLPDVQAAGQVAKVRAAHGSDAGARVRGQPLSGGPRVFSVAWRMSS